MKRWLMVLPLAAFLVMAVFLYRGLYLDPAELPSAMIGKPFPAFSLPDVQNGKLITQADLLGKPALVNVWGTWCISCRVTTSLAITKSFADCQALNRSSSWRCVIVPPCAP